MARFVKALGFVKKYWCSITVEILIIVASLTAGAMLFGLTALQAFSIYIAFLTSTIIIKKKMHYAKIYKCAPWSSFYLISLCYIFTLNQALCYFMCIFLAYIISHRADIKPQDFQATQWKAPGEPSKYQDVHDYIKFNVLCPRLKEYDNWLKEHNTEKYLIFKNIFLDRITWAATSKRLGVDTQRIVELADEIAIGIRASCKF